MKNNHQSTDKLLRGTRLTMDLINEYLKEIKSQGLATVTIASYRRYLTKLYETLPGDKLISRETLKEWQDDLRDKGYYPCTINVYTSAINGLLNYLDRRDLQIRQVDVETNIIQPELTRAEYLRLLSAARIMDSERTYLLVKVFANTDLPLKALPQLTVESAAKGDLIITSEGDKKRLIIPDCLCQELLDYAKRSNIASGSIFATKNGRMMDRSNITLSIQRLSHDAQVPPEKCNPRCLRKLHQSTQAGIMSNISVLVERAYNKLLEQEQLTVGWDA